MLRASMRYALGFLALSLMTSAAAADDWMAERLRGPVQQLVGANWMPIVRGDVVSDHRQIRTLATGHVTFTRGAES
jgi:hypothetical protein